MKTLCLAAALAAGMTTAAGATTIDFESLASGSEVGTIGLATFSAGTTVYDFGGLFTQSGVNTIGGGGFTFFADITVTFSQAVSNVGFWSGGDNTVGVQALIDVLVAGAMGPITISLLGDGNGDTTDFQDLSAFTNVLSFRIYNVTDPFGLIYDDFSFDPANVAPVPLPASALLLLAGFAGLAGIARRKPAA